MSCNQTGTIVSGSGVVAVAIQGRSANTTAGACCLEEWLFCCQVCLSGRWRFAAGPASSPVRLLSPTFPPAAVPVGGG
jgi:hypothetical protein